MSHLQRRYLDYFYVEQGTGKDKHLVKVPWMKRKEFMMKYPMVVLPTTSAVFPCQHEERGFLPLKGKKRNLLHASKKSKLRAKRKAKLSK